MQVKKQGTRVEVTRLDSVTVTLTSEEFEDLVSILDEVINPERLELTRELAREMKQTLDAARIDTH